MSSSVKNQVKVGNICISTTGEKFLILAKYGRQILIKFLDDNGYECIRHYQAVRTGGVRNPYKKSVYGVGAKGVVENLSTRDKNYNFWLRTICKRYANGELPHLNQRWLVFEYWLEDIKMLSDHHEISQNRVSVVDPFDLYHDINNLKVCKNGQNRFCVRLDLFSKDVDLYGSIEEASEETGYHRETITIYAQQQKVVDGFQYYFAEDYAKLFLI